MKSSDKRTTNSELLSNFDVRLACGLVYNFCLGTLRVDQRQIQKMSQREIQCVLMLDQAQERGLRRHELLKRVWGDRNVKSLDVHLYNLRKKLLALGFRINWDSTRFYLAKSSLDANEDSSRARSKLGRFRRRKLRSQKADSSPSSSTADEAATVEDSKSSVTNS